MRTMASRLRRTLFAGVAVLLPPLFTIFLISIILGWIEKLSSPLLRAALRAINRKYLFLDDPRIHTILGIALSLVIIYLTGLLATNYFGKRLLKLVDQVILQIPIVKGIYGSAKQLLEAFSRPEGRHDQQVVLVEYPRKGMWVVGFCTADTAGDLNEAVGRPLVNVFLPTTPNPTSGYLLLVPKSDVIFLDMSIEDAVKFVVSGGLVQPEGTRVLAEKDVKVLSS